MTKIINIKNFYLSVFIMSIMVLLSAIYIEYIIGAKPCKLCLYQRFPYILSIFICFLGFNYSYKNLWIYLLLFTFFVSFILSLYHVGIEQRIFPEFSGCTSDNLGIVNKDELLNSLNETPPNCKDVNFRVFGLSLATLNVVISLVIVVISGIFLKYEKKNR